MYRKNDLVSCWWKILSYWITRWLKHAKKITQKMLKVRNDYETFHISVTGRYFQFFNCKFICFSKYFYLILLFIFFGFNCENLFDFVCNAIWIKSSCVGVVKCRTRSVLDNVFYVPVSHLNRVKMIVNVHWCSTISRVHLIYYVYLSCCKR